MGLQAIGGPPPVRTPRNRGKKAETFRLESLAFHYLHVGPPPASFRRPSPLHPARQRHSSSYKPPPPPGPTPLTITPSLSLSLQNSPFLPLFATLFPQSAGVMAGVARGTMALTLVLAAAVPALLLLPVPCSAELQRFEHPVKADGSLSLLVVGDWGRKGEFNQSEVATQMGRIGEEMDIDFVISTGDNFYEDGLAGVDDKAFEESFTNIYTAESLQKQWYSVLGNHDYRGDALAQLSPVLRKIDSRWLCLRSFVLNADIADFFFVDTTPLVQSYWTNREDDRYEWREDAPRETYISDLLKDLDAALKESTAPWKIVVGHHTMRSVSVHGDTAELLTLLLPVLKANGVDLYVNGHDHCLEHISSNDSPIQYLTSGGGSKAWRGVFTPNSDELRFFYDGQGFMSMRLTRSAADVAFYDVLGNVLYKWSATKQLNPAT